MLFIIPLLSWGFLCWFLFYIVLTNTTPAIVFYMHSRIKFAPKGSLRHYFCPVLLKVAFANWKLLFWPQVHIHYCTNISIIYCNLQSQLLAVNLTLLTYKVMCFSVLKRQMYIVLNLIFTIYELWTLRIFVWVLVI